MFSQNNDGRHHETYNLMQIISSNLVNLILFYNTFFYNMMWDWITEVKIGIFQVDFDEWFTKVLSQELKIKDNNYRIIRRRVCQLIGEYNVYDVWNSYYVTESNLSNNKTLIHFYFTSLLSIIFL